MTISEMKEMTLRQLQEDVEDVSEYDTLLSAYLDLGYAELMFVRKRGLVATLLPLSEDNELPERYHMALVDYATYRILANGNTQKQQRANTFLARFLDVKGTMKSERDEEAYAATDGKWSFTGLYDR